MARQFHSIHLTHPVPLLTQDFSITCAASTDIWDKAPSTHVFNAPIIYTQTSKHDFVSARLTVSGAWKDRFDQGGLCVVIKAVDRTRWIKAGIEVEFGQPNAGVVVKDDWADWSLRPLLYGLADSITIEARLEDDGDLWIHALGPSGERSAMRQITWWGALAGTTEVWVGPYAAKPAPNGEKENLVAHFRDFSVNTR